MMTVRGKFVRTEAKSWPGRWYPRRMVENRASAESIVKAILDDDGTNPNGGTFSMYGEDSLTPEQKSLMAAGHGRKIYSCGHESRCRCKHGSELPVQKVGGLCDSCKEKNQ